MRCLIRARRHGLAAGLLYAAATTVALVIVFASPAAATGAGPADLPLYLLILAHGVWAAALLAGSLGKRAGRPGRFFFVPELLLALSTLFFLFNYIYALNANMEYVERFVDDGTLRLALDTTAERLASFARFSPFLVVNAIAYIATRIRYGRLVARVQGVTESSSRTAGTGTGAFLRRQLSNWGLLVAGFSAVLQAIAFPSFAFLDGVGFLGWVAMVPLFLLFRVCDYRRSVFYGAFFGTLLTMASNYWLATFNLVSLQFAVVLFFGFYLVFMLVMLPVYRSAVRFRVVVLPLAWTFFELARSSGFLGYPWTLLGHSQFANVPLIQISSITGVWGVSFLLLLVNSGLAETIYRRVLAPTQDSSHPAGPPGKGSVAVFRAAGRVPPSLRPALVSITAVVLVWALGVLVLRIDEAQAPPARSARVALIQQNTDPRKAQYSTTLGILQDLTNEALEEEPDLVAWSETAFVPNIRRWAAEDPPGSLTGVVNRFLDYQESIGTWLVTGNDDYELIRTVDGQEVTRNSYNASVLFDDEGRRRETYRKIRLVPFTEYFPYQNSLPWVYEMLQEFDVYLWEPGRERTVFEHPKFTFSTPICFEDVFPNEVRRFVDAGAEVILNQTNDYWSLTEVQAKQHYAGAMFRAVENRRPMLRSTSSGLTSHIDSHGRLLGSLPYYEEAWMTADVALPQNPGKTVYTRLGDWFPLASLAGFLLIAAAGVRRRA
ncbi:MAG: apolipoprotein N-acyltransferase [Spirochaetales bacterium]